jgi:hypothetical protein
MSKRKLSLSGGIAVGLLICFLAGTANAVMMFDVQRYKALVDASSPETIPPGTQITLQNWRKYQNFMPMWLQAAYSGDYHWHIGTEPEFTIVVGPTTSLALPKKFLDDSEKFHNQVVLSPLGDGGFTIKGYTAGVPFPNPTEPNRAAKIMYNEWLPWRPLVSRYYSYDRIVDVYGNVSREDTDNTFFTMAYVSDENYPTNQTPYGSTFFQAGHYYIAAPEQSKYTTELQLQPKDPTELQELYVFLPSLRRSLRLSSAARCTPLLGTDYIADDGSWLPPNFAPSFLGEKKILVAIGDPKKAFDDKAYLGGVVAGGSFPGWPVAGTNHWELRDVYVMDLLALPKLGNYCYSHRVQYVDKENWNSAETGAENYDKTGKLYKILWTQNYPIDWKGVTTTYAYSTAMSLAMDFQNAHVTWNNDTPVQIDDDVPEGLRDLNNSTPAALDRVMK